VKKRFFTEGSIFSKRSVYLHENLKQTLLINLLKESDMIKDIYPYFHIKDNRIYTFFSEGVKGKIQKVIIFTLEKDGKWNLAFGDWENNDVDDKVMTNNQDVVKVIGTVAKVTYEFFDNYPDAIIVIKPVDEKRKKLYNIVFQRHYNALKEEFHILGINNDVEEVYSPEKMYDSFELFLKSK
jgi:hypothetical protein